MAADPGTLDPAAGLLPWEPYRRIGTIANRAIPHVSPWMPAREAAAAVRSAGADEALVADGDGTPVGMVTAARLDGAPAGAGTGQLMTPIAAVLHESVPVSVAASLMACLPTDRIAVISDGRRAIGVLAPCDLLRRSGEACHRDVARAPAEGWNPPGTGVALPPGRGEEP